MKKFLLVFIIIFTANDFAHAQGSIFIIGGGKRPDYLMQKFVELTGGEKSKIVIFPMASSEPKETAEYQIEQFKKLGCENLDYIICDQNSADSDSNFQKMKNVKGIFFSGGDQNRLTEALLGTKLLERIKKIYENGGAIGGTSAGAAVMSKIMITGDELLNSDSSEAFSIIQKENIKTAEGFGFVDEIIVDQHFVKRKRHNRLISLVLENPQYVGIGIDESTALIVYPENNFEVLGETYVMVFDARAAREIKTGKNGIFGAQNIKTGIYISGDKFQIIND